MKNMELFWPAGCWGRRKACSGESVSIRKDGRACGTGWYAVVILIVAFAFSPGCSQQVARLDERDFRDPLIRKAQSKIRQGDKEGAILSFNKALERRPELAQAHLELALLYDDYKKDYVIAIYHYQRYLDLRPTAQKRKLIEDLIRKSKVSFAAAVAEQLPETEKKMQALEEENRRLKTSLREVRENLARHIASAKTRETPPSGKNSDVLQSVSSVTPTSTVYYVQEGDTLSLIAGKVYNNPGKWKIILDANRAQLASPDRLKNGQVLMIPR